MTDDFETIVTGLRAWTKDHDPHVRAAVELLTWHGYWLRRRDFQQKCIARDGHSRWIRWDDAREFCDDSLRASTSEHAILDLAVALGENRFRLSGMGNAHSQAIAEAVAGAAGIDFAKPAAPRLPEPERWLVDDARKALARWDDGHGEGAPALAGRLSDVLAILDRVVPQGGDHA